VQIGAFGLLPNFCTLGMQPVLSIKTVYYSVSKAYREPIKNNLVQQAKTYLLTHTANQLNQFLW
jgi:hypothetical protein